MFGKKQSKGHNLETKKGGKSFLCTTCRHELIYIPIKLHEDILNGYGGHKNVWKKLIKRI